jgi:CCR4-NOT transcription complex subunit 3
MEKFKAVEKAMKTKAYSKEGLSAAAKLDPKERAKMEACDFLGTMVDELERQIETLEAEGESIQATMKKGKNQASKADRMAEIERITERHKWHQGKLELIKRSLENGGVETEQVNDLEETIRYYVTDGMNEDFMEDDEMYDDLNLDEEEDNYGMNNDNDRVSSQDTQSIQEEAPDTDARSGSIPGGKSKSTNTEPPIVAARRPSTQMKSPLPALATLHTPLSMSNGSNNHMKPAAVPTRAPGETLKYASAAAAAAASDKMGIAPLPPPPEALPAPSSTSSHAPLPAYAGRRPSVTASPTAIHAQPASSSQTPVTRSSVPHTASDTPSTAQTKSPALSQSSAVPSVTSVSQPPAAERAENVRPGPSRATSSKAPAVSDTAESSKGLILPKVFLSKVLTCHKQLHHNPIVLRTG